MAKHSLQRGKAALMQQRPKLPGAHPVFKKLANGQVAIYWYRFRGGPLIARYVGATKLDALRAERQGAGELARAYAAKPVEAPATDETLRSLVLAYRKSPRGFQKLRPSTKKQWEPFLSEIVQIYGDMPLKALKSRSATIEFTAWRDRREATPRGADYGMQVLKRVMSFGMEACIIDVDPVKGIKGIYKSNRADQIVTEAEFAAMLAALPPRHRAIITFAAETGMRRGDIVNLKWSHLHGNHFMFETLKSSGRKRVTVPITNAVRKILEELELERREATKSNKVLCGHIFISEAGTPWSENSITQAWGRARKPLGITKHFNDLRGTAITRFALLGLSNEQIADVVGWEVAKVSQIRKHYVDANVIARDIAETLERRGAAS